ncbi:MULTISPECIES: cytochrome d ubiquinol oxidase subunit II [Pandoraea]|uniref:Ubiquinol oxidase subunit II n=1 Tax=Pandoraea capi TaxID=2508286 RepID=A0ABY6W9Y0_9BURK|nr:MULTISPECIES: cytochrome d ubiquinol oxidase subunit II [Pandoraea]MCI3206680.1 cytochrome d ubiquinol oxidase subunit II [Pandoraea sp. LA3]MDN4584708.1 cytochrome d ubiquinol oxidase subunit II [Pandoraea capi]VVE43871.1 ubiquinol oxidase subunit II [Pandoraea capi]
MDLTLAWAAIIALGLFLYVVLDGFDLGIGILFPFFPDARERDTMMNSVAPVWDGNETWLVLGGAGLLAAFPMVYSVLLSALYLPLVLMLVCLIFRGVAFEIRGKSRRTRQWWDLAFIGGSAGATFFQGVALGAYLSGIPVEHGQFAGDAFAWVTAFNLFTGLGLLVTYALLGACWLIGKTEGDLQRRLRVLAWPLTIALVATMAIVSLWTPLRLPLVAERWFDGQWFWRCLPVPFVVAGATLAMRRVLQRAHDATPFWLAIGLVFLGYSGLLISAYPYAILPGITLWDAAAPHSSLSFTMWGAAFIIPVILAYTMLAYWVFRGKVAHDAHYH